MIVPADLRASLLSLMLRANSDYKGTFDEREKALYQSTVTPFARRSFFASTISYVKIDQLISKGKAVKALCKAFSNVGECGDILFLETHE